MGEQKPLHTYLYSFCTGDIPNLFVFLWSGFTCLGLSDWDKTKKRWSRAAGRRKDRLSPWGQRRTGTGRNWRGYLSSMHPKSLCLPAASIFTQMCTICMIGAGTVLNARKWRKRVWGSLPSKGSQHTGETAHQLSQSQIGSRGV